MSIQVLRSAIEGNIVRIDASRRGGGVEVDVSELFPGHENPRVTAYQNYLGGGMLGRIMNSANFEPTENERELFDAVLDATARYFHEVTNAEVEDYDEWAAGSFERVQRRPVSGF